MSDDLSAAKSGDVDTEALAGDSTVQGDAEAVLLSLLSESLGSTLGPARLHLPDGSYVDVDGVSRDPHVLVEAWAHQGPPKGGQTKKVLTDALKLTHAAAVLEGEWQKILLFSDQAAAKPFLGTAWYAGALRTLGVEIHVVEIEDALRVQILEAQRRQFR